LCRNFFFLLSVQYGMVFQVFQVHMRRFPTLLFNDWKNAARLKRNESDWLRGTPVALKCASVSWWACQVQCARAHEERLAFLDIISFIFIFIFIFIVPRIPLVPRINVHASAHDGRHCRSQWASDDHLAAAPRLLLLISFVLLLHRAPAKRSC
jgi:hypothetical protein